MASENFNLDFYSPFFSVNTAEATLDGNNSPNSLKITETLNTPSHLSFTINKPLDFEGDGFEGIDKILEDFNEDKEIEAYIGYFTDSDSRENPYFTGTIKAISHGFSSNDSLSLSFDSYDGLYPLRDKMPITTDEKNIYQDMSYDEIIKIVINRNNLQEGIIDSVPFKKRSETQNINQSDYQFINYLAERIGFEFFLSDEKFYFRKPLDIEDNNESLTLEWGKNLISFQPRLSTANVVESVTVHGRNVKDSSNFEGETSTKSDFINNLKEKAKIKQNIPVESEEEAKTLAEAILFKHNSKLIEGKGETIGTTKLKPGTLIKIQGIGKKFSGIYYVKEVTHNIAAEYKTSFKVRRGFSDDI